MGEIGGELFAHRLSRYNIERKYPFVAQFKKYLVGAYKDCKTRSEVDKKAKQLSAHLTKKNWSIGKDIVKIRDKDIEHLVNDVLFKSGGTLKLTDVHNINKYFKDATLAKVEPHRSKSNVYFNKYEITIRGKKYYLKVQIERTGRGEDKYLHSINDRIST